MSVNIVSKTLNIFNGLFYHQQFSLPDSVIYYITKYPTTPKVYEKLVQSCKYFYIKNPIILFDIFQVNISGNDICWIKSCDKRTEIEMNKISFKFWIIDSLNVFKFESNYIAKILPKMYKCDATYLNITGQNLSFKEFLFLSTLTETCSFNKVKIQDENGKEILLEKIIQNMPTLKKFYSFSKPNISSNSVKHLLNIPHFTKLSVFSLKNVNETFDIETFYCYSKTNQNTKFTIHFENPISEEFKDKLEKIVDELIQTENLKGFIPPIITYPQMGVQKFKNIMNLNRKMIQ